MVCLNFCEGGRALRIVVGVVLAILLLAGLLTGGAQEATCPPPAGTPKSNVDANGDGTKDWLIDSETDKSGNKVEVWCLDLGNRLESFGQRYVPKNGTPVWIGKCPYNNATNRWSKEKDFITRNWKKIDWKNWDNKKDGSADDEGKKGVIDDWKWVYNVSTEKLKTSKTEDGIVVAEEEGPAPDNFNDLTFANLSIQNPDNSTLPLITDPAISLIPILKGPVWEYGLKTPPAYPDYGIDPSIMVTNISVGDTLTITGVGISDPYVTGNASRPKFGSWNITSFADDYVTFVATENATIDPNTTIEGFGFYSSNSIGIVEWMTGGDEISFAEMVEGPVIRRVVEIIDNMSGVPQINQSTMNILAEDFINFNAGDKYNITITRVINGTTEFNKSGTLMGLPKETIKVDWTPMTQGAYILLSDANTTTEARIVQVINKMVISSVPELSTIARYQTQSTHKIIAQSSFVEAIIRDIGEGRLYRLWVLFSLPALQ